MRHLPIGMHPYRAFIASYAIALVSITLDLDHTDDVTYAQQALSFYKHHCYLPLLVFEANSCALVTAVLHPGKHLTGAENAMIMKRVAARRRPLRQSRVNGVDLGRRQC